MCIFSLEYGLRQRKQANIEEMKKLPLLDTEITLKSSHKGKSKSSIPYNAMTSEKYSGRGQTRYRTRANSSEQAGLLESAQSSQRSSVEVLNPHRDSSEKIQLVDMNMMPDIWTTRGWYVNQLVIFPYLSHIWVSYEQSRES